MATYRETKNWVYCKFPNNEKVYKTNRKHLKWMLKLHRDIDNYFLSDSYQNLSYNEKAIVGAEKVNVIWEYIINNPSSIRFFNRDATYRECAIVRRDTDTFRDILPRELRHKILKAINQVELINGQNPNHY